VRRHGWPLGTDACATGGDVLGTGDVEDGTAVGLTGVGGGEDRLGRGELDGLAEPVRVGLGDPVGLGDNLCLVGVGVGVGVRVVAGWVVPAGAGVGRTRT
jgi:hypothetical protein